MRDDDIAKLLRDQNPWWRTVATHDDPVAWATTNRTLTERAKYDLGYRPSVLKDVVTNPLNGNLTILTGPRRIGKSVALMDAITEVLSSGVDPRHVIHATCDGLKPADLRRMLVVGRSLTASLDDPSSKPRIWLLDEIGMIKDWSVTLKVARDQTDFGDDTVVLTSSKWQPDEDIQGNLLAGRAGSQPGRRIRQLLPMAFGDFVTAIKADVPRIAQVHPAELQSSEARTRLIGSEFLVDDYDLLWQGYLTCGGFPRAVFEHSTLGGVTPEYARDLIAWLRDDVDPDASQNSVPLLLSGLERHMSSPLNVAGFAEELKYPTRYALETRLNRLINSHALIRCHKRDLHGEKVAGAQNKYYLTDPLLAWISNITTGLDEPDTTRLSEAAIGVALARAIEHFDEGRWVNDDTIGYLRIGGSGKEVDLAPVRVPSGSGPTVTTPIEGKWVDGGKWKAEGKTMSEAFGRGIMATKSSYDLSGEIWAVPAPLVAMLLI